MQRLNLYQDDRRVSAKPSPFPWPWVVLGLVVIALVFAWWALPVSEWTERFRQWITGLGHLGYLLFALVYIVGAVFLVPETPLSIAGGLAFGAWAIPLVVFSATVGASLAFLLARYVAYHHVERQIRDRPKFKAVHEAIGNDGWKIVLLLRLSPVVPFNLQNYFFGITNIPFWHYAGATGVGIIPGTCLYVYLGVMGQVVTRADSIGMLRWIFLALGLIATIVVTIMVSRKAKATLDRAGLGTPHGRSSDQ
ncbi:MAG: TVP38/TMEM64 family protein [Nitrospira sp.]|nr:TVP38/TMEM64 family protein [Nitrospira sp.]